MRSIPLLTPPPQTWQEISTLLIVQFHPPDYAAQNMAALHRSRKQPTKRLHTYWHDKLYICKCVNLDMPEVAQCLYLQRGLQTWLQCPMIAMPTTPLPEVLCLLEIMDAADQALEEDKRTSKSTRVQSHSTWSSQQPSKGQRGGHHSPSQKVSGHFVTSKPLIFQQSLPSTSKDPTTPGP